MDKFEELVDWVAREIFVDNFIGSKLEAFAYWKNSPDYFDKKDYYAPARRYLSHPDLALIDRNQGLPNLSPHKCNICDGSGWLPDPPESYFNQHRCEYCNGSGEIPKGDVTNFHKVIPLVDALKEE